jgi:hypothetical protein
MPSSPWNYISHLWTVQQFKVETDNGWGRSQLRRIDQQLSRANAAESNPSAYVQELGRLIDECREWMISKEKKFARKAKTRSYEKRLAAISNLMAQALRNLKFFAFEGRKQQNVSRQLVGLKPGYDRERKQFEDMKNLTSNNRGLRLDPQSTSYVAAGLLSHLRPNARWYADIESTLQKDVDALSDEEFAHLLSVLRRDWGVELNMGGFRPRVHYIRKCERINNNMLIPITGLLYKDTARCPYTSAGSNGRDIYAIDKYGNLMSVADDAHFDDGTFQSEHRHSSLNAGNGVVCAGYIGIQAGVITYIDNRSGHYKPTERDLARAVCILMDEHSLDLKATKIVGYRSNGPNSVVRNRETIGGRQFLSQVIPPPPLPQPY